MRADLGVLAGLQVVAVVVHPTVHKLAGVLALQPVERNDVSMPMVR